MHTYNLLSFKKFLLSFILFISIITAGAKTQNFNDNWNFSLGDFPNAIKQDFNDSSWRNLNLPHDWAFEGGYSPTAAQKDKGGYAVGGIAWYRKSFSLSKDELENKIVFIDFEGVYMNSEVWVNGVYLGKRPYGYISFSYEISEHLKEGENFIALRVDNSLEPSARWYHPCGIYANVALRTKENLYFEKDGTFVQTPTMSSVKVSSEIIALGQKKASIAYKLRDAKGSIVAKGSVDKLSFEKGLKNVDINIDIKSPKLWSPESPTLYTLNMEILDENKKLIDEQNIKFGFRSIEWSAEKGFILNGNVLKLQGVCEHLEGGATGGLTLESIARWKLHLIKDMGCNAVRFTHNPFPPIYYDICDEIGLLVMDEVFDGWKKKADFDYGFQAFNKWWERDLEAFLRRDRNHPCVFLYSLGNETHGDIAKQLVELCHKIDPTRKVSSGDCNPDDMDVYGVNGRSEKINGFMDKWDMRKAFVATENPHTWQVRGYYRSQTWYRDGYPNKKQDTQYVPNLTEKEIFTYDWAAPSERKSKKQVFNSSYDNAFVRVTARHLIQELRDRDWFSGSFRWTGFDYRGEAGYVHGGWPFRAFQSGTLDMAGFKKDLYYLYQSQWSKKDMVHILPHWTHPKMEIATKIPVWVYTNGDEVELFLNEKSLGRKKRGEKWNEMQIEFLVPWQEAKLEAVAYRNGAEIARATQQSASAPTKLNASLDENFNFTKASDIAILTIREEDEKGTLYPYGENRIYAKTFGAIKVLSFENGSPINNENNFEAESMPCFMGLNRIFIQSTAGDTKEPKFIVIAGILGDKKLMLSDKISIVAENISLDKNEAKTSKLEIRYTLDSSEPTLNSPLYSEAFSISLPCVVKAKVYENGKELLSMTELFAEDEGLYWGDAKDVSLLPDGMQAEDAVLKNVIVAKNGNGFYGDAYVKFRAKGSSITFYQENDGDKYYADIIIRYSQKARGAKNSTMEIFNDNVSLGLVEFKNTGSEASDWKEQKKRVLISSGGNNIKIEALDRNSPSIDQIKIEAVE